MHDSLDAAVLTLTRLARVFERASAPLSLADFRALSAIADGEGRASRLAQRLAVGKPSISATVDSLSRRGFLERHGVEGDQRARTLRVTDAGLAAYAAAQERLRLEFSALAALTGRPEDGVAWLAELGASIDAALDARATSGTEAQSTRVARA